MKIFKKIMDIIVGSEIPHRHAQLILTIVFIVLAVGIISAGAVYYINFEKNHLQSAENELTSIAKLKVGEIVQWRKERIGDGSVFYHNLNFSIRFRDYLERPNDADVKSKIMNWLIKVRSAYQYNRIIIYDIKGKELASFPEQEEPDSPHIKNNIASILNDKKVQFLDFHRDAPGHPIHLSVIVPIYDETKDRQPLGVLMLRIIPENYLYPLIKRWPVPSETGETLLVRREGEEVVFLNSLRFKKYAALSLRIPLTQQNLPAVHAVKGKQGIFSGKDYRGIPVLSAIQPVPNSPWYFVAKMDLKEIDAPIRARLWAVIIFVLSLLGGAGGFLGLIWHQQTTSFYREKIKASEAVKESEARYRLLADHMSDTVWLMDLNLKTIYTSPSVKKFRGYTPDEIKKLPLEKHLAPESYQRGMAVFRKEMEKIRKNPSYSFVKTLELEFYRKDGSTVWSENKFSLIRDEKGMPISILGEGRDITERRHSEEALRFSEEKFRKAFFTSPDSIAMTRLKDGMFLSINEGFTQITGYTEAEVMGKSSLQIKIWKDPEDRRYVVENLLAGKDVRNYEATFLTKHGEIRGLMSAAIIELQGEKYILTITRDITERKIAEEKIKTSERFLNSIIDQSPYPMWISDNKGTLIRINKACLELLHLTEDEVVGKYNVFKDNIVKEQGYMPLIRKVFNEGESVNFELTYDSSKLNDLDLEKTVSVILDVTIFPIRDAAGEIKNAVIQHRDITERKAAEKALRESEGRVRAKLNAILYPKGDIGELDLADIINAPAIQHIMDTFYKLTNIGIGILDIKGNVLIGTGWQDICTKYHRIHPETNKYCLESDTLLSKGIEPGSYKMYKCKNNIWDIATPIMIGGKHLGNLFLGQFLFDDEPLDEELFKAQAKKYKFDENEYLTAYKNMPRWNRETVDAVMSFYIKFAELISELSYNNIRLARTLSERDRFMTSLKESEERYRNLIEYAPDAIFINLEEKVVLVNDACLKLFGASKEDEIIGKSPFELFHPDYHEQIRNRISALSNKDEPVSPNEEKIIRLDGAAVDVEVSASTFSWGGKRAIHVILRDITERKKAEEKLKALTSRQEAILAAVPDILMEVDANKIYKWANQPGMKFFGDDVIGKEAKYYFEDEMDVYSYVQPLFSGEEDIIYVENWQRRRDGEKRLLAWVCKNLRNENGKVTGALSSARDITESREAEEELNRLYAELEQRVKDRTAQLEAANKELEAFSYSVSHDLRAPLRHMSGFVDLLEKRFSEQLPEKGQHYMKNIADSAHQMGTLIDDLLAFSRTGRAEMHQESLDMNGILKESLEQFKQDTENRKIEWIIPTLPQSYGDQSMLKLVWTNLLANAIKFTRDRKQAKIEIGAEGKDGEIIYFIKDNGVGFDMQYSGKLFGVFQRMHSIEDFEGTGVGLANVRRIIARHGGRTWAEAKINKGATFFFSMPKRKEIE